MSEDAPLQPAQANQASTQDLAETEKQATELARSLSLGLLDSVGIAIPTGIDYVEVTLSRPGPDSLPGDSGADLRHADRLKISVSGANRRMHDDEEGHMPTFNVDAHGPNIGDATGPLKGDGKFNNHMPYTAEDIRDAMQRFKDMPGEPGVGLSFTLPSPVVKAGLGLPLLAPETHAIAGPTAAEASATTPPASA